MRNWLFETLAHFQAQLALMLGLQLFIACLVAIQPVFFQQLLGLVILKNLADQWSRAFSLAASLGGIFLLVALAQGLSGYIAALFSSELLRRLQTKFFDKTAQLPLSYFQRHCSGEFFTRFNHDVGQAQSFIANVLPAFVREGVTASALGIILVWSSPGPLVLATGLITAGSAALAAWCHRILERLAVKQRAGWSEINRQFDETVRGIDTIKTFAAEARRGQRFDRETCGFRSLSVNAGKTMALFSPLIDIATRLGGLTLVVIAYWMISRNQLGADTFLLFFFCSALLQGSAHAMIQLYTQMPPQLVALQNLSQFFSEKEENIEHEQREENGARKTMSAIIDRALPIEFRDLHFAYPDGRELYGGARLKIPASSITLVQGPNGSGKSTLINLLLRFNTPRRGAILLGGRPISEYSRKELRTRISVVTQYHHIFHDTLRENLLVGRTDATDAEIAGALDQVGLTAFLKRLPHGLDQVLDATGKSISGGERQRICIARLLLRRSPILVLDEPWSNLDEAAARVLARVLDKLRDQCTLIVITHRRDDIRLRYDSAWMLGGGNRLKDTVEIDAASDSRSTRPDLTSRNSVPFSAR